ncbi:hypothetical protein GEMRC1_008141 [Eukaryota sp. GEM-RC1]
MLVICLEGPHGVGKSSLLKQFAAMGFPIFDEAFLDLPHSILHPQSLTMELEWVSQWFQRLLRTKANADHSSVYIADRSPFSAELYAHNGDLLSPILHSMVAELERDADIKIVTVYLKVSPSILWERIQTRLALEPQRRIFNEDSYSWMEKVLQFYDSSDWSYTVANNSDLLECLHDIISTLDQHEEEFEYRILSRCLSPIAS